RSLRLMSMVRPPSARIPVDAVVGLHVIGFFVAGLLLVGVGLRGRGVGGKRRCRRHSQTRAGAHRAQEVATPKLGLVLLFHRRSLLELSLRPRTYSAATTEGRRPLLRYS